MFGSNNKPKQAKKDYTGSLSEEKIEKESSAAIDYYNTDALKNSTKFNADLLGKSARVEDKSGPKSAGEAMTQETCRETYPLFNVNLAHEKRKCQA
jgi:hypothetical protein